MKYLFIVFVFLLLVGCTAKVDVTPEQEIDPEEVDGEGVLKPESAIDCEEPRPEECNFMYAPVCGSDTETYSNSCEACNNPAVLWFVDHEC